MNKTTSDENSVTLKPKFLLFETKYDGFRPWKVCIRKLIVGGFLDPVWNKVVLECPSRCGSVEGRRVMLVPSGHLRTDLYTDYVDSFVMLSAAAQEKVGGVIFDSVLTFSAIL